MINIGISSRIPYISKGRDRNLANRAACGNVTISNFQVFNSINVITLVFLRTNIDLVIILLGISVIGGFSTKNRGAQGIIYLFCCYTFTIGSLAINIKYDLGLISLQIGN